MYHTSSQKHWPRLKWSVIQLASIPTSVCTVSDNAHEAETTIMKLIIIRVMIVD